MEKKKLLAILALTVVLSVVLSVTVAAGCDDPCEPDPCDHYCSPGFWKNHTKIWKEWAGDDYGWMIAGLKAKGWEDNRDDRWVATETLNEAFPNAPCD